MRLVAAASFVWCGVATAAPTVTIHTKDGSTFHGELVERVPDDHVTVLLATGAAKRIRTSDIEPLPKHARHAPAIVPAPTETVRTKDHGVVHGSLVERVLGDHVTVKLDTGELRTLEWVDVDEGPILRTPSPPRQLPVQLEVLLRGRGWTVGDVIEKVVGDHLTLRLDGEVETFPWGTFRILGRHAPDVPRVALERMPPETSDPKAAGVVLTLLGALFVPMGVGLTVAALGQRNAGTAVVASAVDVGAIALVLSGLWLALVAKVPRSPRPAPVL